MIADDRWAVKRRTAPPGRTRAGARVAPVRKEPPRRRAGRADEAMAHLKQAAARFAEIGGDADEMQPAVWMLVEW
jgi:hypothetical protein